MKMKPEHFEALKQALKKAATSNLITLNGRNKTLKEVAASYIRAGMTETRLLWDLFQIARNKKLVSDELMQTLYQYLDDNHIETALRQAYKEGLA